MGMGYSAVAIPDIKSEVNHSADGSYNIRGWLKNDFRIGIFLDVQSHIMNFKFKLQPHFEKEGLKNVVKVLIWWQTLDTLIAHRNGAIGESPSLHTVMLKEN